MNRLGKQAIETIAWKFLRGCKSPGFACTLRLHKDLTKGMNSETMYSSHSLSWKKAFRQRLSGWWDDENRPSHNERIKNQMEVEYSNLKMLIKGVDEQKYFIVDFSVPSIGINRKRCHKLRSFLYTHLKRRQNWTTSMAAGSFCSSRWCETKKIVKRNIDLWRESLMSMPRFVSKVWSVYAE